ncbi:hypothetical protein MMC25_006519 [Agyrium rufum]|nr:hypothetical protein [Agyrium rufum]
MDYIYSSLFYYTDSWVEVSSRPSSSSLSSIGTEENELSGLRVVRNAVARRRRRRLTTTTSSQPNTLTRDRSVGGSSQDEYEESESESDRIMSSSNEELPPLSLPEEQLPSIQQPIASSSARSEADDDDDENSTAVGVGIQEAVFTPQPNVFSHPPTSHSRNATADGIPGSYFPAVGSTSGRATHQRHSYPTHHDRTRSSHTPYNMISPSYQADQDAALRASLSTLLSCAAAARGLPKRESTTVQERRPEPSARIEPTTIRMMPESTMNRRRESPDATKESKKIVARRMSETSSNGPSIYAHGKRKSSSRDRQESKKMKKRASSTHSLASSTTSIDEYAISPTLMTWVVSAGVVVLFSAISFSAGFAYGRDVGMMDTGVMDKGQGVGCGREMGRSLRRLRWGTATTVGSVG